MKTGGELLEQPKLLQPEGRVPVERPVVASGGLSLKEMVRVEEPITLVTWNDVLDYLASASSSETGGTMPASCGNCSGCDARPRNLTPVREINVI